MVAALLLFPASSESLLAIFQVLIKCSPENQKKLLRSTRRSLDLQFVSRLLQKPDANLNCYLVLLTDYNQLPHALAQCAFESSGLLNLRERKST